MVKLSEQRVGQWQIIFVTCPEGCMLQYALLPVDVWIILVLQTDGCECNTFIETYRFHATLPRAQLATYFLCGHCAPHMLTKVSSSAKNNKQQSSPGACPYPSLEVFFVFSYVWRCVPSTVLSHLPYSLPMCFDPFKSPVVVIGTICFNIQ